MQAIDTIRQMMMVGCLALVTFGQADQRIVTIPYNDEEKPFHFMVWLEPSEGERVIAPASLLVDPQGRHAYVISMGSSQTITVDIKDKKLLGDFITNCLDARIDADGNLWYVISSTKSCDEVKEDTIYVGAYEETIFSFAIVSPLGWDKTPDTLHQKYSWIKEIKLDTRDIDFEIDWFVDTKEVGGNNYFLWFAHDKANRKENLIVNLLTREKVFRFDDDEILLVSRFRPFIKDQFLYVYDRLYCEKFKSLPSIAEKRPDLVDGRFIESKIINYCGRQIQVYDLLTRRRVLEYQLPASGLLSTEEKNAGDAYGHLLIDGRGHHYVEVIPNGSEWQLLETEFGNMYVSPRLVLEYDASGQFVGVRGKVYCPYFSGVESGMKRYWDVDTVGNLYYLKWTKDGVEVWLSPAKSASRQPK